MARISGNPIKPMLEKISMTLYTPRSSGSVPRSRGTKRPHRIVNPYTKKHRMTVRRSILPEGASAREIAPEMSMQGFPIFTIINERLFMPD